MLSWDDFRQVKAIADSGSLNAAAQALGINHSTAFRRLGQIEQRLGSRLFKRERTGYSLTPAGEEMVRLAERMEQDVASFARGQNGKPAHDPPAASGVVPAEPVMSQTGLEFLEAMVAGKVPQAPMAATLGFRIVDVSEGRAVFEGMPEFRLYNPIGTVHGGFAASLLDSALGCAIFSTLAKGEVLDHAGAKAQFRACDEQGHRAGACRRAHHPSRPHRRNLGGHAEGSRGQALRPRHHDVHDLPGEEVTQSSGSAEAEADDERKLRSRSGGGEARSARALRRLKSQ